MQLPFAVIPLVRFVTDREKMGRFVIAPWLASLAWVIASVIVVLNVKLLFDTFIGGFSRPSAALARRPLCVAVLLLLPLGHPGHRAPPADVTSGYGPVHARPCVGALGDPPLPR